MTRGSGERPGNRRGGATRRLRVNPRSALRTPQSSPAFTLLELLVVVAVLGLLVGMLVPSLLSAATAAQRMRCTDNLRHIHAAVQMYLQANRDLYPCAEDPVSTKPFYWLWMGRGWRRFVSPYLGRRLDADRPSVLLCPGDPDRDAYEATSYAYCLAFYHTPEQIDAAGSKADTYSNPKPSVAQGAGAVAEPERKILIGEWTANHPRIADDGGWWCWRGARNFLFPNGTVRFVEAERIRPANDGFPDANLTRGGITGHDL